MQNHLQTPPESVSPIGDDVDVDGLKLKLEAAEKRYERVSQELNRMRRSVMRAGGSASSAELRRVRNELEAIKRSTVWRLSAPLRALLDIVRQPKATVRRLRSLYVLVMQSASTDGWPATLQKINLKLRQRFGVYTGKGVADGSQRLELPRLPHSRSASRLALRVLLIAETTLPQCYKYRVAQKQKMIEYLGYECTVVSWREPYECMAALQTHSAVIFYRTPSFPEVMRMIEEARQLGIPSYWEVDDLIFDADKYATNSNLKDLSSAEMQHLLSDAEKYRAAMLACDHGIASTPALADAMREAGLQAVHVVENALDEDTLHIANMVKRKRERKADDGMVRIVYGSGTRTHDTDFRLVAPAILDVLRRHPHVRLRIVGQLNLPTEFDDFESRIERVPPADYATYLAALGDCDVNIAPLDGSVFSDAKSNIKFLEGAVVGLPSVCSPRSAFRAAITNGVDGFLADTVDEWEAALEALVCNAEQRKQMGRMAHERAIQGYGHTSIAVSQVRPILEQLERADAPLRVLAVNIFFEPRSFGGATVVAEEMAKALNAMDGVEYHVFTSLPTANADAYSVVRYDAKGAVVFGMGLPPESDKVLDYDNPFVLSAFAEALRALRPNVVHLHSVQGMGAAIADICQLEGIPYVVTLHDAWWICARQFMITPAKKYCYQEKIDLNVCAALCVNRAENEPRQNRLHEVLQGADMLLSPSEFFRDIYVANGFDPDRVQLNKNGVRRPARPRMRRAGADRRIRFGYVGGDSHIKGAHLLKKYFANTKYTEYDLVVVDNTLNLGMRSISARLWACTGRLIVRPAYTQETIDDFFDEIDVLLFPTQWKESFGLTVREALIRDVWVVATNAGGVVEDIVDGENGNIVPFEDDGDVLATTLDALLADPSRVIGRGNPHKRIVRTIEEQAAELASQLATVARKADSVLLD